MCVRYMERMAYNAGFLFGFLRGSRLKLSNVGLHYYTTAQAVKLATMSDCVHVVVVPVIHACKNSGRVIVDDSSFTSVMGDGFIARDAVGTPTSVCVCLLNAKRVSTERLQESVMGGEYSLLFLPLSQEATYRG